MIFRAGPSKFFPCRQFFFPAVSRMKSWNVFFFFFAQRYFLPVAFISCLPALLGFTGSKFPCGFISCCCSGDLCNDWQVHLRICSHYNNKSRSQEEQHSQVRLMILQDHALGISHRVSWKHRAQLRKCFVLSNEQQLSQFKSQNEAGCGDSDWNLPKCRLWDDSRDGTMPLP